MAEDITGFGTVSVAGFESTTGSLGIGSDVGAGVADESHLSVDADSFTTTTVPDVDASSFKARGVDAASCKATDVDAASCKATEVDAGSFDSEAIELIVGIIEDVGTT